MNALKFIDSAKSKEIDIVKNAKKTLNESKKINSEYNYFLRFSEDIEEQAKNAKKGRLYGLSISVKDCI